MPRDVPSGLADVLASEAPTLAVLVLIERKDGVKLGFTSADVPITYGGDTYYASDGVKMSAIQSLAGTGIDNADVLGILSDDRIEEADIDAGLYDGASITVWLSNRINIADGVLVLLAGHLGNIDIIDGSYRAEVLSISQLLRQKVGWRTSATCRCRRLGDAQCKLNMAGNAENGTPIRATKALTSAVDSKNILFTDSAPSGHYTNGIVKMTSGPNDGIEREVKVHIKNGATAEIELRQGFPFLLTAGETALLEAGCSKLFTRCDEYFGNANNFHGEHQLPGNDKVSRQGRPPSS